MWCFENPFNSGQRTLECCQAGSIDGNVNGLGSFFSGDIQDAIRVTGCRAIQLFKREGWTNSLTSRKTWPRCKCHSIFQQELQASISSSLQPFLQFQWHWWHFMVPSRLLVRPSAEWQKCQDFLPRHCVGTLGSVCETSVQSTMNTLLAPDWTATDDPMRCRMGALLYNWQRYQAEQLHIQAFKLRYGWV